MTSAVLDVALCLLLVSAAAVTVASVPDAATAIDDPRADDVADALATTTATVNYSIAPSPRERSPAYERQSHGTIASLLARAAVADVHAHGAPLVRTADDFRVRVLGAARASLPPRTQVVVRWRPFPGSHLGRTLTVGPDPPVGASVHAATVHVPTRVEWSGREARRRAHGGGFDGLADLLAARVVAALFPVERGRLALAGDPPVPGLLRTRYRRVASHYGVVLGGEVGRDSLATANGRIASGVSEQLERDLRRRFDAPERAAVQTAPGRVVLVVRTWSA